MNRKMTKGITPGTIMLLLLLLFLPSLHGQTLTEGQDQILVLDYSEAWEILLDSNPDYLETRLSLSRASAAAETTLDSFIPQISGSLSADRSSPLYSEETSLRGEEITEADRWDLSAGISARLTLSPSLSRNQRLEVLQYRQEWINAALEKRDLQTGLQKLWLEILSDKEETDILRGDLANAQSRLDLIQQQYNSGLRSERELLSARLSVARIQPQIQKQLSQIEKNSLELKRMLGVSSDTEIILSEEQLPLPFEGGALPAEEDLEALLMGSLQMQRAFIRAQMDESGFRSTRAEEKLPSPSAGVSIGLGWESSMAEINASEAFTPEQVSDSLGLSLRIDIPLSAHIPGSSENRKVQSARDDRDGSERNIENTRVGLYNQLESLLLDIRLAQTNRGLNDLTLEIQRQDYAAAQRSYSEGTLSLLEQDEAFQELRNAEQNYRREEQNYLFLLIDLQELIAKD